MDQPNVVLLVGLAFGLAAVVYVLWGGPPERRRRPKGIAGLTNLGSTCFLNTLLQSLASCAHFVEWLDDQATQEKPLTSALQQVLWILNGRSESDTHSPELVVNILRKNGLRTGQQADAHELFNYIITALQEENKRPIGSVSDALPHSDTLSQASDILEDPFDGLEVDTFANNLENGNGNGSDTSRGTSASTYMTDRAESEQFFSIGSTQSEESGTLKHSARKGGTDSLRRGVFDRSGSSPPPISNNEISPFTGLVASSLTCCTCGHSSSVQTATFDSVSLALGETFLPGQQNLKELIRQFVRTEIVPDVHCEKCAVNTSSMKTYNFGKLPACLCFHVGRIAWHSTSGTASKREDYVNFPEYLVMDPFTWKPGTSQPVPPTPIKAKYLYRLKSVVVHVGNSSSGHFLTYRRGPLSSIRRHEVDQKARYTDNLRWYRASDEEVEETSMRQAMDSLAYMLFYEKCTSDLTPYLLGEVAIAK